MSQLHPVLRSATKVARIAMLAAGLSGAWAAHAANCTDAPVSGRSYYITNKDSGLQLDVSGNSKKVGAPVIQWGAGTQTNQQWTFYEKYTGVWTITAVHSGQVLDLSSFNPDENIPVTQYTLSGWANQQWLLAKSTSGDAYTIVSNSSKKLLTVPDKMAGSTLRQHSDQQGSGLQRWYLNPVDNKCSSTSTAAFGSFMGFKRILVGGSLDYKDTRWGASTNVTDTMSKAPWDVRYDYVHSTKYAPNPSCYANCSIACLGWWGCESMSSDGKYNLVPGTKITGPNNDDANFFKLPNGQPHTLIHQWTWYMAEDLSRMQGALNAKAGGSSANDYQGALNNGTLLKGYLNDYRFFLNKVGNSKNIIELEPDLFGYLRVDSGAHPNDAHYLPAAVQAASGTDCPGYENSVSGLVSCMMQMARYYAPNASVGMHFSCWDIAENEAWNPNRGVHACIRYYKSLSADQGDFLVGDVTDRDAAWAAKYQPSNGQYYAWDDARFFQALALIKLVTEGIGKPMVLWQIPLGNELMTNQLPPSNNPWGAGQWKDDKVKHFFTNMDKVADAHIVALQFGSGWGQQTTTETDGGYFLWYGKDYYNKGGVPLK